MVYVAEQTEPVRRRVALEVIKLGMDTKQVVARFEAERQVLAMMDHPNIAKVLDAGTTGDPHPASGHALPSAGRRAGGEGRSRLPAGRPYFVTEPVRGIRITDYCYQANLTTRERLDLFIKVCQAIQHAHQKGISPTLVYSGPLVFRFDAEADSDLLCVSIRLPMNKHRLKQRANSGRLSRRDFLTRTTIALTAAGVPWFIPARALGRNGAVAPSEKIVLGGIGLGPRGQYDLSVMLPEKDVQFVAICDVARNRREQVKKMVDSHYGNQDCRIHPDMFELLARPDIDAVLIATGDHWHALASLLAAKAGKDVYSEKPCGMTISEIQSLADGIHRYGRVFQAGTQRRSISNFQYAVHLAQSGKLGRLHTLHASVYVPAKNYDWLPAEPEPVKGECDWDRWLGPAPWRPYNSRYVSGGWRGHHDFEAGGNFLDWGAHTVDLCQWANQADHTTPIEYEANATSITANYANGVKLVCDFLPTAFGNREPQYHTSTGTCPVRFEGDEGWVETGDNSQLIFSEKLAKTLDRKYGGTGLSSAGHGRNFFDCVRSRGKPACNQDIMRRSHIACFAAQLSWQLGRKLTFDPIKEEFVGDEAANRMRRRATREPWSFNI